MTIKKMEFSPIHQVDEFYSGVAEHYDEQYDPDKIYTIAEYPANLFRLRILKDRIRASGARRVIDMGIGEGTPAVSITRLGVKVVGFDFNAKMVMKAKDNYATNGLDPKDIIQGDIQHRETFEPLLAAGAFDAALCLGVIPHVNDDISVLKNIRCCLVEGGRAFVSFRNSLFSLFTMNRYTRAFFVEELLCNIPEKLREAAAKDIESRVAMDKPPLRAQTEEGGIGYDTILAKFHNPFEAGELFAAAGFRNVRLFFYHYHPVPPMLNGAMVDRDEFRRAAVALENFPEDWRGYFLCSAYLVEASA